jgi:hypothetical protein
MQLISDEKKDGLWNYVNHLTAWHNVSNVFTEAKMLQAMKDATSNYVAAFPNTPGFIGFNRLGFRDSSLGWNHQLTTDYLDWLDGQAEAVRDLVLQGNTEFDNDLTAGQIAMIDRFAASAGGLYSHWDLGDPQPDNEASHQATLALLFDWGDGHVNLRPRTMGVGPADNANRNHHAWFGALDQSLFAGSFHV